MSWPMTEAFINSAATWVIDSDRFHRLSLFHYYTFPSTVVPTMPALIPVDEFHGALLIAAILSSILYGVTWLQVYSYYNSHSSRDRWPLRSFVAFLMFVDTANLVFVIYQTYQLVVTNFGVYLPTEYPPWGQAAIALSSAVLDICVQHFYAYRIYCLSWRSPYLPAAISVISLIEFGLGLAYGTKMSAIIVHVLFLSHTDFAHSLKHTRGPGPLEGFFVATLSVKVLCDVFITVGMVYTLLTNRTRVRRTNSVLNLLAIYAVNCGTLHLVFAISSVILFAKSPYTLKYTPSLLIMIRLSLCAFMAILNSRDNLRETLDGPGGVVSMFTSSRHAWVPALWPRKK
ncbi:hypothetical protein EDB85DRAFT_152020 [Lactarius pseudohatsudake]|nr:hypothetical protein EDB85DRAFT_152020 [Lactarius pseudohatsudake]